MTANRSSKRRQPRIAQQCRCHPEQRAWDTAFRWPGFRWRFTLAVTLRHPLVCVAVTKVMVTIWLLDSRAEALHEACLFLNR